MCLYNIGQGIKITLYNVIKRYIMLIHAVRKTPAEQGVYN